SLEGTRNAAYDFESYLAFYKNLYTLPVVQEALARGIRIDPLSIAISKVHRYLDEQEFKSTEEDCIQQEWSLVINTNGDVYPEGDCYNSEFRYGNIFDGNIELLILSEGRRRRMERSRQRLQRICNNCMFY